MALGFEQLQYGMNMATAIRLSPTQLPKLYNHLPPICEKLGIAEPEFYLQMDPVPNAWTFGDTKIFITITSGLVELLNDEELDAVIAHECGHILCHHVLYHIYPKRGRCYGNIGLADGSDSVCHFVLVQKERVIVRPVRQYNYIAGGSCSFNGSPVRWSEVHNEQSKYAGVARPSRPV